MISFSISSSGRTSPPAVSIGRLWPLDHLINGPEELFELLDGASCGGAVASQRLVDAGQKESRAFESVPERTLGVRTKLLPERRQHILRRGQHVLCLGGEVGQVVAFDLIGVCEHQDQFARVAGCDDLAYRGEGSGLHRLCRAIHEQDRICQLDAAADRGGHRRRRLGRVSQALAV